MFKNQKGKCPVEFSGKGMIKKHKFNCPVVVKKLPDYKNVNTKLLEYFDTCDHEK